MIKQSKIQEKFKLFSNDNHIKTQLNNYDTMMANQEKQEQLLKIHEDQKKQVTDNNNMIYQLRQKFLLLKQSL